MNEDNNENNNVSIERELKMVITGSEDNVKAVDAGWIKDTLTDGHLDTVKFEITEVSKPPEIPLDRRIREACERWIRNEFSGIPGSLLAIAYPIGESDGLELIAGGRAECQECGADASNFEVDSTDDDGNECLICDQCGFAQFDYELIQTGPEYAYPAGWGTLFHPDSNLDEDWIRNNAQEVAKLGFLVYDCDETGILVGIDGGGYDFYDAHWIPLYKLRGLKWHGDE